MGQTLSAGEKRILELFPPGRRREILFKLAKHPEWDDPDVVGVLQVDFVRGRGGRPTTNGHLIPRKESWEIPE